MDVYQVSDIFTPTSPARLTFIEREEINKRIVRALRTTGNHIVVYGHSGCGKTTLIENKLHQVYENHIRTNCMSGMTYEGILLDAFDQLSPYYTASVETTKKEKISTSLSTEYFLIKSQISAELEKSAKNNKLRILPPQLTAQNLARFMGESNSCWILEDFHKLKKKEKQKLAQLMKVFMDISDTYKTLKIIYIGAVNSAREVVQLDREMRRRVSEIHVPLMTEEEIIRIVRKGFSLLNIGIEDKTIILDLCNQCSGLPAICHKLCLLICEDMDLKETSTEVGENIEPYDFDEDDSSLFLEGSVYKSMQEEESESVDPYDFSNRDDKYLEKQKNKKCVKNSSSGTYTRTEEEISFSRVKTTSGLYVELENLKYALSEYLEDESDTIKCAFELAFQDEYAEDIIESLAECDQKGALVSEILENIKDKDATCSKNLLNKKLKKLIKNKHGAVIRHFKDSDVYCFSEPFYRTFALSYFERKVDFNGKISEKEKMKIFHNAFNSVKSRFG